MEHVGLLAFVMFAVGTVNWVRLRKGPYRAQRKDYIILLILFSVPFFLVLAWVPIWDVYQKSKEKPASPEGYDADGYQYNQAGRVVPEGFEDGEVRRRRREQEWALTPHSDSDFEENICTREFFARDVVHSPEYSSLSCNIYHISDDTFSALDDDWS